MGRLATLVILTTLVFAGRAEAQQAEEFGDYIVHYNAINTNLLTPQIAQSYGIHRSSSRTMLNITVMKKGEDNADTPVHAKVGIKAKNLTGQFRDIEMREINDNEGAVYYIGEITVRNLEMFDFTVSVTPETSTEVYSFKFRQQFYTE